MNPVQAVQDIRSRFIGGARRLIGKVPFLRDAVAMYYCMCDRNTPLWAKVEIATALGYLLMPMDAIPDPTPLLGFTDDAGAISVALGQIRAVMYDHHYQLADRFFNGEEVEADG